MIDPLRVNVRTLDQLLPVSHTRHVHTHTTYLKTSPIPSLTSRACIGKVQPDERGIFSPPSAACSRWGAAENIACRSLLLICLCVPSRRSLCPLRTREDLRRQATTPPSHGSPPATCSQSRYSSSGGNSRPQVAGSKQQAAGSRQHTRRHSSWSNSVARCKRTN
jgi:hypothetical protein